MDIQKMRVRADLERMVLNYRLMDRIKSDEADQIISCLDRVIGYAPAPQAARRGKIIPFPGVETKEQKHGEPSRPAGKISLELCQKIYGELGLEKIKYLSYNVLTAIRRAGIKSVEELAGYPLEKLTYHRGVGEKAVSAIRAALKAKGYTQEETS